MRSAAAKISRKRLANFDPGWMWVSIKEGLCRHYHSIDTIAALGRLLCDERLLQRVRFLDRAEPFKRYDRCFAHCRQRKQTGTGCLATDNGRACPALLKAASEFWSIETQIVTQNVEKRRVALSRHGVLGAIHIDAKRFRHRILPT
jgi:hypothetical protein